jgi:hypothetical protein
VNHKSPARAKLAGVALLLAALGCGPCSRPSPSPSAAPTPLLPAAWLPPPSPWVFALERRDFDVALPDRCRPRGPLVRAKVSPSGHFFTDGRSLGALAVGEVSGPQRSLARAAAITLEPEGESHDPRSLPWLSKGAAPRIARLPDGEIVAAFDRPGEAGASRVGLFRSGASGAPGAAASLGEGDAFEALDLACAGAGADTRCVVFTSRLGRVAPPGATLWAFAPHDLEAPAEALRQVEILPAETSNDARPFGLDHVELAPEAPLGVRATAVLADKEAVFFMRIGGTGEGEGARAMARLSVEHGVLDAATLPTPVAMTHATPLDEDGCAKGGLAAIRFEREGLPRVMVSTPSPPSFAALRRLERGGLAVWLAPLGCKRPRQVVYAVVLDAEGAPVSAPMAVADGTSFAVAAAGSAVDLFIESDASVSWTRMTCAP